MGKLTIEVKDFVGLLSAKWVLVHLLFSVSASWCSILRLQYRFCWDGTVPVENSLMGLSLLDCGDILH